MADSYMDKLCPQGPGGEGFDPLANMTEEKMENLQERAHALKIAQNKRANGTVVFDIDGVLSDSRWRLPIIRDSAGETVIENRGQLDGGWDKERFPNIGVMLGDREERWSTFYGLMPWDQPYPDGAALLQKLRQLFVVELWTGRPEWTRELTLTWMVEHDLLPGGAKSTEGLMPSELLEWSRVWLHMRPNQSRKPGSVVKTDWLRLFRDEDLPDPLLVFDDDPDVVAAFGLEGVPAVLPIWHGEGVERVRG